MATRYAVVGGLAGLLYLTLSIALERTIRIGPQAASALGLTAASLFAYVGHHTVTFSADGRHGHYAPRFIALALAAYAVSFLLIRLLVETHATSYAVAALTVAAANAAVSYGCNRVLIFRPALQDRGSVHSRSAAHVSIPCVKPGDGGTTTLADREERPQR